MQSRAHVETDTANAFDDRACAADPARRTVERREEPVTGGVDFVPAKSLQLAPDDGMVALEGVSPRAVAERPGAVRRADDVGEHQVASTRSGSIGSRVPVRNSWISARM